MPIGPEDLSRFAEENRIMNNFEPSDNGYRRSKACVADATTIAIVVDPALNNLLIAGPTLVTAAIVLARIE